VVVVELSGVALPANVIAGLASYRGRPFSSVRTVTLVDPTRLEVLLSVMTPLAEAQLTQADEAVVTKRDEATADEIAAAGQAVARLNGAANLWQVNATDATSLQPLLAHLEGEEAWK
jgi:G3E family GTPase